MNDNNKYCCDTMDFHLTTESEELVEYKTMNRKYSLKMFKSSYGTHQPIVFCPWCSEKLPKDLNQEWEYILEKEYGIKEPGFNQDKIPPEFKTDEWWKKRGL
jgi:hypothetical protein